MPMPISNSKGNVDVKEKDDQLSQRDLALTRALRKRGECQVKVQFTARGYEMNVYNRSCGNRVAVTCFDFPTLVIIEDLF
jgi:hypothetical protein